MDPSKSHHTSVTTKAIRIPLHGNTVSSHHTSSQHSRRRIVQGKRPSQPERTDSDGGSLSSSSLGSDWASSPISPSQATNPTRLGIQLAIASPPAPVMTNVQSTPPSTHQRKDKQRAGADELPPNTLPSRYSPSQSPLGPSMISDSAYKSVNLNSHYDPESKEPARLITYTKYAQGFTWNDELFLPSYLLGRHRYRGHGGSAGRRRWAGDDEDDAMGEFEEEGERCPVTDIFVTDEEAAAMMP